MKSIFLILAMVMSIGLSANAQPDLSQYMVEDPGEAPLGKLFDEAAYFRGELPVNQFVNVIVINKAAKGEGAPRHCAFIPIDNWF